MSNDSSENFYDKFKNYDKWNTYRGIPLSSAHGWDEENPLVLSDMNDDNTLLDSESNNEDIFSKMKHAFQNIRSWVENIFKSSEKKPSKFDVICDTVMLFTSCGILDVSILFEMQHPISHPPSKGFVGFILLNIFLFVVSLVAIFVIWGMLCQLPRDIKNYNKEMKEYYETVDQLTVHTKKIKRKSIISIAFGVLLCGFGIFCQMTHATLRVNILRQEIINSLEITLGITMLTLGLINLSLDCNTYAEEKRKLFPALS